MNQPLPPLRLLALATALFSSAHAVPYTWNSTSTGGAWDTTTAAWTTDGGATSTTWVNGNDAVFGPFSAGVTIANAGTVTVGTLTTNGGSTIVFNGGGSLDVTNISTAGATGSNGSMDMFLKLTGSHDLNYSSTGTSGQQGRLNLKAAADYTGDTYLTGTAYLMSDNVSNALPTGTTLNMTANTTFRLAKNNITQQIAGLAGSGTITVTSTGNTLTISTKSGVTTSYAGSIGSSTALNLVISGSGTQALTGSSLTFNGSTSVNGGTLSLGNNLTNTSSVTIGGGTLVSTAANVNLGVGAVSMSSGAINVRGTGSVGKFTLAAGQNFTATGGTLYFDIGGTFDQIAGSGAGTFNLADVTLSLSGSTSVVGTYQLFSGFASGSVSNLTITGLGSGFTGVLDNTGLLTVSASAVPEPSTFAALAGAAALGFVSLRRRR